MSGPGGWRVALVMALVLAGCAREARDVGPGAPQSAPNGPGDRRIGWYQDNAYQVSQGGRWYGWYGCGGCHGEGAVGALDLADGRWARGGGFDRVYAAIADGHGALRYGARVPAEPLWQLTAYVRDLPKHQSEKRRRVQADASAEPQAARWTGPMR